MTANILARRPAETAGATIAGAALVAHLLGVSIETASVILAVAGFAPAVVTWLVARDLPGRPWRWLVAQGGIRGVVRMLWGGR